MCINVEIAKSTTGGISGNFRSIGIKPVPYDGPIFILTMLSPTSSWVCNAEKGIIPFTNVLQGHDTVILVCCTIEWELNITCNCNNYRLCIEKLQTSLSNIIATLSKYPYYEATKAIISVITNWTMSFYMLNVFQRLEPNNIAISTKHLSSTEDMSLSLTIQ